MPSPLDLTPPNLPAPIRAALSHSEGVVVKELTTLICADEGCQVLTQWLIDDFKAPPILARLGVRALAQGLKFGSKAMGEKGLEVLANRLTGLPFVNVLMDKITTLAGLVAGGQIKSHAQLAQHLAGKRSAADVKIDPGLKTELRVAIRQSQNLEKLLEGQEALASAMDAVLRQLGDANVLPLDLPTGANDSFLFFGSAKIPFFGREDELADLQAWLEAAESNAGWRLVHGEGGHGKSRLALELCLRNANLWDVGFLARGSQVPTPDAWRPAEPTLIVIDYAALNPERAVSLILAMKRNRHQYAFPVRVLLLERGGEDDRWYQDQFLTSSGAVKDPLLALKSAAPLGLGHLGSDALVDLMAKVAGDAHKLGEPETAIKALGKVDPHGRALFAVLVALHLGQGGDPADLDRASLIDDLLRREVDQFWRPAAGEMSAADFQAHLNLLAFASFVGRLPLDRLWRLGHRALPSDDRYNPGLMQRMCGRDCRNEVWPLEPDLVGERLLLNQLSGDTPPRLAIMPLLATVFAEPLEMADWLFAAQVIDRLMMDYPADAIELLNLPDRESVSSDARESLANAAMAALGKWPAGQIDGGLRLYEDLKTFAGDDATLRLEAVRGGTNLLSDWPENRLAEGLVLYSDLKIFAADDPALRHEAIKGGFNLLNKVRIADLNAARSIYEDLKAFAGADPAMMLEAARGATNLLGNWPPELFDDGRALYHELKVLAGDDPTLRLEAAYGAKNLLGCWPRERLDDALVVYQDLKVFAGDDAALKLQAAQGVFLIGVMTRDAVLLEEGLTIAHEATTLLESLPSDYILRSQALEALGKIDAVLEMLKNAEGNKPDPP